MRRKNSLYVPGRARLVGIIILAKFLKMPLTKYELVIEKVESSLIFAQLWPGIISTNLFPRAGVLEPTRALAPNAIGQLRKGEGGFYVSYRHPGLAREYLFDEAEVGRLGQYRTLSNKDEAKIQALRRQMRLINTRNRLTYMVLMGIAEHQGAYLASGDPLGLKPFSQVALAEWIRSKEYGDTCLPSSGSKLEFVDNSMISKLTQSMSVLTPQGEGIPLRDFFSSTRDVHKRMIEAVLNEEKEQFRQGDIKKAYTDEEIRERLEERFGVSVSRRTVTACRRDMRILSSYARNNSHPYPPNPARFSFYYPLNVASVKVNAPEASGVYEISLAEIEVDYPLHPSGVVYIGSARNLRRRLRDHLRPGSKNGGLRTLLDSHICSFRYILERGNPREVEKELCQAFSASYGSLPRCNRIKP